METNPLQQLRDIHLPADPSWWPPAIGWWLLLLALIALLIWSAWQLVRAWQRRAPLRAAADLLDSLHAAYRAGALTSEEYLNQGNAVLKRLLVRALGRREYAELAGRAWLETLNDLTASNVFTESSSSVLGEARYQRSPEIDVDQLNEHFKLVVARVRP